MRKAFDKELYNKYDIAARTAVKELLKGTDWTVQDSEKKMAVDLEIYEGTAKIAYIETEVKLNWNQEKFQYGDVQWPERKWKYCKLDKPTIFLMFNHDLSQYLTATGDTLLSSKLEMIRNKYVKYGENFFKVPVDKVIFNDVQGQLRSL